VVWRSGGALVTIDEVNPRRVRLVLVWWPCPGSIPAAEHLSRYVTSHPGQLSLAIPSWVWRKERWRLAAGEWRQVWFVCGRQVKLCDPLVTCTRAISGCFWGVSLLHAKHHTNSRYFTLHYWTVAPSSVVGRFLLQARQRGTGCQTVSVIRRSAKTFVFFAFMSSPVCLSSVRLSSVVCLSVTFLHSYSGDRNFRQCFYAIW